MILTDLQEKGLTERGFLDFPIDPSLDLKEEINKLRKEKNAVILAHYYQNSELQEIADFVGDSLQLSQNAAKTDADVIVFAGVYFMAETAKILSPEKKVLLPDTKAGCSLVDSCPTDDFKKFKKQYPGHVVVTYINSSAELKAESDIIVTSANAEKIIRSIPKDQPIIFCPDKNLGRYLIQQTGRDMVLWDGACIVHEVFSLEKIKELKELHPKAKFIAHPECKEVVLMIADFVGSTSAMLKFTIDSPEKEFVVITEEGVIHQMRKSSPHKTFIPAPPVLNASCACNECVFMKLNTMQKLYMCLKYEQPEITLSEELRIKALKPIQRMLELS